MVPFATLAPSNTVIFCKLQLCDYVYSCSIDQSSNCVAILTIALSTGTDHDAFEPVALTDYSGRCSF
jgi:hypothetical protein